MTRRSDSFIPGVHSYCDRCCWRCSLSDRCAIFARAWRALDRPSTLPTDAVTAAVGGALIQAVEAMRSTAATGAASRSDVSPDFRVVEQAHRERERQIDRDVLVALAADYARTSWPILQALRPILTTRGDAQSLEAAGRLEEICITVATKAYRAVRSALEEEGQDAGRLPVQSDANGSAKVALLLIEESRRGWRVLMQPGRATANGAPAALVRVLDELEAEIRRRFPRALEFIRPGFDTEDAHTVDGRIAAALRAPPPACGRA